MKLSSDEAASIGLKALGFLVSEPDRAQRFLSLTGLLPADLGAKVAEASFLAGVLDHLLSDESLLLVFAQDNEIDPQLPRLAAIVLNGGNAHAE